MNPVGNQTSSGCLTDFFI